MTILSDPADEWFPPRLGLPVVGAAFAALTWWSWRKWPDVLFDFGNQLYLAWQLSLGKALYLDIDYKEGPLSQYVNAMLFALFSPSFTTLVWFNLALLAALTWLIYRIFARACGPFTATVTSLVFLGVFAFTVHTINGNYNYVCPYTHEQTHGIVLAIATIATLGEYARRRRVIWCALAGACVGLVFLTKAELFVPAAAAAIVGVLLASSAPGAKAGEGAKAFVTFGGAAIVPVVLAWVLLATLVSPAAARGVTGNWAHARAGILDQRFYLAGLGLDDPWRNLGSMLTVFLAVVAAVGGAAVVDGVLSRTRLRVLLVYPLLAFGVFAVLPWNPSTAPWQALGRALPLTTLLMLGAVGWLALQRWRAGDGAGFVRLVPLVTWAVLAFALLLKVVLNVRLSHYGFVLAMPATLLVVAMLTWLVPGWLRARRHAGSFAQALLLAPVMAVVVFHLWWSNNHYAKRTLVVGDGGDAIYAYDPSMSRVPAGLWMAAQTLRERMPPDATLLVLPEGTILNYWLRRANPTRYTLFTPNMLPFVGGEAPMLRDLEAHPPDFIALVHRTGTEFAVGAFGVDPDWGRQIMQWVNAHYVRIGLVGAEPFAGKAFGVVLLRRISDDRPGG